MGLAASQARLISLTSRQHSVEYNAQRLLNRKMELSNDSDAVYARYMDALDSVKITTKQTNSDGRSTWIAGNINNLMRIGASENTTGEVFYLQKLDTGELYVPDNIVNDFEASTDIYDFVSRASGGEVSYTEAILNSYIEEEYNEAIANGWNNLSLSLYSDYNRALVDDIEAKLAANNAYKLLPRKDHDGIYQQISNDKAASLKFKLASIINSRFFETSYSTAERGIISSIYNCLNGNTNLDEQYSLLYNLLNEANDFVYDDGMLAALSNYRATTSSPVSNMGDAITMILTSAKDRNTYLYNFFTTNALTQTDIDNYLEYVEREKAHRFYEPYIERSSNNPSKAKYWEEIYKAMDANGYASVSDSQAKNDTWVTNIIKSNLAILTTWDDENEMLSKTASELSFNIREVTDENAIERAGQKYEAEMAEINAKDVNIDEQLNKLETERTTITTEIQGIKTVLNDNVEAHFKTFA